MNMMKPYHNVLLFISILSFTSGCFYSSVYSRACGDEILVQVLDRVLQNSHGGTQVRKVGTAYKDEKDDEDTNKENDDDKAQNQNGREELRFRSQFDLFQL